MYFRAICNIQLSTQSNDDEVGAGLAVKGAARRVVPGGYELDVYTDAGTITLKRDGSSEADASTANYLSSMGIPTTAASASGRHLLQTIYQRIYIINCPWYSCLFDSPPPPSPPAAQPTYISCAVGSAGYTCSTITSDWYINSATKGRNDSANSCPLCKSCSYIASFYKVPYSMLYNNNNVTYANGTKFNKCDVLTTTTNYVYLCIPTPPPSPPPIARRALSDGSPDSFMSDTMRSGDDLQSFSAGQDPVDGMYADRRQLIYNDPDCPSVRAS